jgi:MFS transporter, DHA1 family, multidrug resistance protein
MHNNKHIQWSESQCLFRLFPLIISVSFAMDVFVPSIPQMGQYFGLPEYTIQASLYIFMLTVAVGLVLIGPLSQSIGRRLTALSTALFFLLGSLLSAQAESIYILLLGRVIQAFGACGTYLLCFIIIRDNYNTQACGRLFSLLGGVNSVLASMAPIIGGLLMDWTNSWRSGFYFLSGLAVIIYIASYKNIPNYSIGKVRKLQWKKDVTHIISNKNFQRYSLIAATGLLALYLFCALSPGILIRRLQLSGSEYGMWFALNACTVFAANITAARLTYYLKLERIVNIGLAIMILASIGMLILNQHRTELAHFMLPMLCLSIGVGLSMGCATALALQDFKRLSGLATSLVSAFQFAVCGIIGAIIAHIGLNALGLAWSVLCLSITSIYILILLHPYASSKKLQSAR